MQFINRKDRLLLIGLSEDSRSTVTKLSKTVGYSRATTIKALDRLKKSLGIRFTLEVDESELKTFERHIIAVKLSKKPAARVLKEIFEKDRYAQNVYLTEGDFDLLIYATAGKAVEYIVWETHLAETLVEYGASIRPSEYVTTHFGYMPLNDSFVDAISGAQKIDDKDREILRLLNNDSRLGYREISKQSGILEDTVRYRLFALRKSGIIKRFTIAVQNPPEGSVSMAYFVNYIFNKETSAKKFPAVKAHFFSSDKDEPILNAFQLIAPISGSYRSFGITVFQNKEEAFEKTIAKQKSIFKDEKVEIKYAIIKKVLKGLLPFRNLDIRDNYKTIEWHTTTTKSTNTEL